MNTEQQLLELEEYLTYYANNWQDSEVVEGIEPMTREQHQLQALVHCVKFSQQMVVKILNDMDKSVLDF